MTDTQAFLTAEKFDELKKELDHLKTVRRKEVAESLEYARSLGDLSENAEYQEARDMQAAIEERISYLEKTIKEAKIVAHEKKLSYLSPLGEALMGKTKGDEFTFETPTGKMKYKVLKVE